MRYAVTALAYIVAFALVTAVASIALLYLVGPHGGVLPQSFYIPLLSLGWMAVIVLPVLFARWMWRRLRVLP
jgi:hypothetical protein